MNRDEAMASARILAAYRRRILLGRTLLPFAEARRLVGPDCAYHLYFRHRPDPARGRRRGRARKRR
jgi:hypothetical protein